MHRPLDIPSDKAANLAANLAADPPKRLWASLDAPLPEPIAHRCRARAAALL